MIIFWLNPQQAGTVGFLFFFVTLFVALVSTVALLGYALRRLVVPYVLPAYRVRHSMRHALFVSTFACAVLLLQLGRLLQWWLVLIMVILVLSAEFIFLSHDRIRYRSRRAS